MDIEMIAVAYVVGEGWTQLTFGIDGHLYQSSSVYSNLSDLLHDLGDCQRCILTL